MKYIVALEVNYMKVIFITSLIRMFILRLRFPKGKSVAAIITN